VYLNDLNKGKAKILCEFLRLCHDVIQYFIDLFWQRRDFSASLADLETVHKGRDSFKITTRLAQALAKQAKECVRSAHSHKRHKPQLRHHTVTLYYHFVKIEPFKGRGFDLAVCLIGSGAPRITIPIHSTKLINRRLAEGWKHSQTLRLGRDGKRLWIDLIFEKPRPKPKEAGNIVGMDSNYKNGFIFSDEKMVGQDIYPRVKSFFKRQKHTHAEIKSRVGCALKQVDFSGIKALCIEDLRYVKHGKSGTFSRALNRRLSHWLYAYVVDWLSRCCEEEGVRLERKSPAYTSQYCRICHRWDRRSRVGDEFLCVHCGYSEHADLNAAKNLALLGVAGVYGLRSLQNPKPCSASQSFG